MASTRGLCLCRPLSAAGPRSKWSGSLPCACAWPPRVVYTSAPGSPLINGSLTQLSKSTLPSVGLRRWSSPGCLAVQLVTSGDDDSVGGFSSWSVPNSGLLAPRPVIFWSPGVNVGTGASSILVVAVIRSDAVWMFDRFVLELAVKPPASVPLSMFLGLLWSSVSGIMRSARAPTAGRAWPPSCRCTTGVSGSSG